MSPRPDIASLLRCPFCGFEIQVEKVLRPAADGGVQYGVLKCRTCNFDYPVVDGIPIVMAPHESVDAKYETNALTLVEGPKVWEVTAALYAGEPIRALSLLFNPSKLAGNWFPRLDVPQPRHFDAVSESTPATHPGPLTRFGQVVRRTPARAKNAVARVVLPHARMRFADFVKTNEESFSALDVMDLYYRQYSGTETYNYFAYRFGQPRHLAALSLASLLGQNDEPILDLACGVGHLTHYLSAVRPKRTVIGLDRDFVRLWLASRFVAPAGRYVCGSADQSLPFAAGFFHGIFCSDAFHLFLYRAGCVREMARVMAQEGTLVVARIGNASVEPREGYELTAKGYARLFGELRHVVLDEDALVRSYTDHRTPDLDSVASEHLDSQKWLSVVASRRSQVFAKGGNFVDWPHAVGRLRINPIYRIDARAPNGDLTLRFEFPSPWYKFENGAYLNYAPERVVLPRSAVMALERPDANQAEPSLAPYVSKFVVIGMPERYSDSGLPRAGAAGSPPDATVRAADASVA